MAKIFGLFGTMTGKVADVVMVVRNGVQVVRKYQPVVSNPSTQAQVAARARLKLMSQLAAVMGPYIAIRREGIVSSRNLFIKANYPLSSFADSMADISLESVQLTSSVVSLPALNLLRDTSNISASISITPGTDNLSRVVYIAFAKEYDDTLRFFGQRVVSEPGQQGTFTATFPNSSRALVVYAYGVRDNTDAASVVFGNLEVPTAEDVAQLVVSRVLTESDVTLTETRAASLEASA